MHPTFLMEKTTKILKMCLIHWIFRYVKWTFNLRVNTSTLSSFSLFIRNMYVRSVSSHWLRSGFIPRVLRCSCPLLLRRGLNAEIKFHCMLYMWPLKYIYLHSTFLACNKHRPLLQFQKKRNYFFKGPKLINFIWTTQVRERFCIIEKRKKNHKSGSMTVLMVLHW